MEIILIVACITTACIALHAYYSSFMRIKEEYRILKKVSEKAEKILNPSELNTYKYYDLAAMKMGTSAILFDFDNKCIETFCQPYHAASDKKVASDVHCVKASDILQIEIIDSKKRTIAYYDSSDAVIGFVFCGIADSVIPLSFGEWWRKKAQETQACLGLYIHIVINNLDKPLIRFPLTAASSFYKTDNQTTEKVIKEIFACFQQIIVS